MYIVKNCPQIKDNFFLKARNIGASRKLKGDIGIIVCFMKRFPTDFPEHTKTQFFTALSRACEWLKTEAKNYGTNLNFKHTHFMINVPATIKPQHGYNLVREFFNVSNMDRLQKYYEEVLKVDEAPFFLVFDQISRSFAEQQLTPHSIVNERSIIFKGMSNSFNWETIAHELLHQFGALDYYYPPEITECAKLYIRDSIMGVGKSDVLDDLTAYLVGMKETISGDSYHFLKTLCG